MPVQSTNISKFTNKLQKKHKLFRKEGERDSAKKKLTPENITRKECINKTREKVHKRNRIQDKLEKQWLGSYNVIQTNDANTVVLER